LTKDLNATIMKIWKGKVQVNMVLIMQPGLGSGFVRVDNAFRNKNKAILRLSTEPVGNKSG